MQFFFFSGTALPLSTHTKLTLLHYLPACLLHHISTPLFKFAFTNNTNNNFLARNKTFHTWFPSRSNFCNLFLTADTDTNGSSSSAYFLGTSFSLLNVLGPVLDKPSFTYGLQQEQINMWTERPGRETSDFQNSGQLLKFLSHSCTREEPCMEKRGNHTPKTSSNKHRCKELWF